MSVVSGYPLSSILIWQSTSNSRGQSVNRTVPWGTKNWEADRSKGEMNLQY